MSNYPTYIALTHTATDDLPFQVATVDMWFKEIDIFVTTNNANEGTVASQPVTIFANDIHTLKGIINLKDLYFINTTGGSNCVVSVVGIKMTDNELKTLGLMN